MLEAPPPISVSQRWIARKADAETFATNLRKELKEKNLDRLAGRFPVHVNVTAGRVRITVNLEGNENNASCVKPLDDFLHANHQDFLDNELIKVYYDVSSSNSSLDWPRITRP